MSGPRRPQATPRRSYKARAAQGGAIEIRGHFYARVVVAPGVTRKPALSGLIDRAAADERGRAIQALVNDLRTADCALEHIDAAVREAAVATDEKLSTMRRFAAEGATGARRKLAHAGRRAGHVPQARRALDERRTRAPLPRPRETEALGGQG